MATSLNKSLLQATFIASIFLFASCSNVQQPEETTVVAEDQHTAVVIDNNNEDKDVQFLIDAAEINQEEIELGQLAQQKGTSDHVKKLGKMMEDAHTQSLNDLKALAQTKNITLPDASTEKVQDAYKNLNEKTGSDFDKSYSDLMVDGHKDAINTFEKASTDCNDPEIKNWATTTLPALRMHLDKSVECQKMCNKMKM